MKKDNIFTENPQNISSKFSAWSVFISLEGILFMTAVILTVLVGLLVGLNDISISPQYRMDGLIIFSCLSFIMLVSIAIYELDKDIHLLGIIGIFTLFFTSFAIITILPNHPVSEFIFPLILFCSFIVSFIIGLDSTENTWESLLLGLLIFWGVSSAIITIGSWSWFPFSKNLMAKFNSIEYIVDLRFFTGIVFSLLTLLTAIFYSLQQKTPTPNKLPPWKLATPHRSGIIPSLIFPIILLINVFLVISHLLVNVLWKYIQLLFILFGRIGINIVKLIKMMFSEYSSWVDFIRLTLLILLVVVASYLIKTMIPHLFFYMLSDIWGEQINHLVTLLLFMFSIVFLAYILLNVIDFDLELTGNTIAKSSAWILMVYFLGGGILYVFKYYGADLNGYSHIGITSIFILMLIFLGAIYSIFDVNNEKI